MTLYYSVMILFVTCYKSDIPTFYSVNELL